MCCLFSLFPRGGEVGRRGRLCLGRRKPKGGAGRVSAERLLISEYRCHAATEITGRALPYLARVPPPRRSRVCHTNGSLLLLLLFFFFLPEAWQNTNGVLGSIVFCRPPTMVRTYHFHTAVHRGGRLHLASICAKRGAGVERTTAALQQAGTSCKRGASGYHDAPL